MKKARLTKAEIVVQFTNVKDGTIFAALNYSPKEFAIIKAVARIEGLTLEQFFKTAIKRLIAENSKTRPSKPGKGGGV